MWKKYVVLYKEVEEGADGNGVLYLDCGVGYLNTHVIKWHRTR